MSNPSPSYYSSSPETEARNAVRRRAKTPRTKREWKQRKKELLRSNRRAPVDRAQLTTLRRRLILRTGMLPLDFLTAVYRDELYDSYERELAEDGKTWYFIPSTRAVKVPVTLDQRIRAAEGAMPYMHKRLPQGIEVQDKTEKASLAAMLKEMSPSDLARIESVFEKLDRMGRRLPASLKGAVIVGARTYDQNGKELEP